MVERTSKSSAAEVRARLSEAIWAVDLARQMQIVSEQIETTEGVERAYWLRYRASLRQVFGTAEQTSLVEADLEEARRIAPHDPEVIIYDALHRCFMFQRLDELKSIPASMRPLVRTELFGVWRFWYAMGVLHHLRRRWHQSFRALDKTVELFLRLPPEEHRRVAGYIIHLRAARAMAALRCNLPAAAALDVALASEFDAQKERKHVHPQPLALARAELALHEGRCQDALRELQQCLVRLAASPPLKLTPADLIRQDLLAARIARADGNAVGFRHFAERGLALSIENRLAWSEATVRAIMQGAPY